MKLHISVARQAMSVFDDHGKLVRAGTTKRVDSFTVDGTAAGELPGTSTVRAAAARANVPACR